MGIPPLLALGAAAGAGELAGSAVRAVGGGFSRMLQAATGVSSPESSSPTAANQAVAMPSDLADQRSALEEDIASFRREIRGMLARKGIPSLDGLRLSLDALGKVRVEGHHPAKKEIEAMFAADGDLTDRFGDLAARAEALGISRTSNGTEAMTSSFDAPLEFVLHLDGAAETKV